MARAIGAPAIVLFAILLLVVLLYLRQEEVAHNLNPQALTVLTLLVAESAPSGKDLMIRLIVNLEGPK